MHLALNMVSQVQQPKPYGFIYIFNNIHEAGTQK